MGMGMGMGMEESKMFSLEEEGINTGTGSAFDEERKLAAMLADAFQQREEASRRYEAITEFLDKYDLDERDSVLLENYNFDNVFDSSGVGVDHTKSVKFADDGDNGSGAGAGVNTGTGGMKDGEAFLDALERVTKIRKELASTFDDDESTGIIGKDSTTGTTNNNSNKSAAQYLGATSAMRMVENLASKQERAFERLYHFLHNHLDLNQASTAHVPTSSSNMNSSSSLMRHHHQSRLSEDDDGMDETLGHPFVRRALIVLKHVPAYYTHTLELIATSRRSEVTRKFLLALTSGYNGMAPIEMKAHDPVNYVGDMLAFVFRTISVESELANGLAFADDEMKMKSRDDDDNENEDDMDDVNNIGTTFMSAADVLGDALGGVARPLKSRISQVVASLARRPNDEEDGQHQNPHHHLGGSYDGLNNSSYDEEANTARIRLAFLYSICGLLLFYRSAMAKAVNKVGAKKEILKDDDDVNDMPYHPNPLVQCLSECIEDAARAYMASLKVYCATLDHLTSMSNESQAHLCQTVILRLCDVRSTSPGFGPDFDKDSVGLSEAASKALSLENLCDTVIEAVMTSCKNIDDIVTIKSALMGAKKAGLSSECSGKWDEVVVKEEEKMIDAQISMDTNYVIDECGLGSIASALESMKAVYIEGMVVSSHPGLSEQSLQEAMKKFYTSLIDPPFPSYDNVKDPVLRKRARNKIAENVLNIYEEIYNIVSGENGGYSDLKFLEHNPDQVKALLQS